MNLLENDVSTLNQGCCNGNEGTDCITTLKVYDQARSQTCLNREILGAARVAYGTCSSCDGEIVTVPADAISVSVENVKIKKITVVDKEPNDFRTGYWDIELQYVFEYTLVFNKSNGEEKCYVNATNLYNKKVTLFGSVGSDVVVATDLFNDLSATLEADPIVVVSAKAIGLSAEIACARICGASLDEAMSRREVFVTIGLFTIVKLCRLVDLSVETRGFCVADEIEDQEELTPCEFFNTLNFPFDVFSPPKKKDNSNCNRNGSRKKNCGCGE